MFLQLFVNDGTVYREELAVTKTLEGRKISISIPIVVEPGYTLRIDPLNVSCVLKNLEIQVTLSDNVTYFEKEYEHNAIILSNQFTFISEDPQLLIKNCYPQSIQKVFISFEILHHTFHWV